MKATNRCVAAFAILGALLCPAELLALDNLWTGGTGNWTDATWSTTEQPFYDLDDRGVIGSTESPGSPTGVVEVNSTIPTSDASPTVVLGNGLGTSGTLNITSGGTLTILAYASSGSSGDFETGLDSGVGLLNVEGTLAMDGQLSAATSADASSTVTLSGSASVTAGSGFLDRNLVIDGAHVSASFTGDLILGQSGIHAWRIPAAGASTLSVGANADLGGTLKLEFPDGAPAVGATWNLLDSATVDANETPGSGFGNIDQSAVPVAAGQKFVVQSVAGGTNGVWTQLSLEQHPVLVVDRATGATSIKNFGSGATVNFDTYVIGSSALGSLNPANWNSIAPANGWVEARPTVYDLSELNPTSSESIAGGSSLDLGTPVELPTPTAFGQETEDIRFRFAKPDESVFTEGTVIYTGLSNSTLTLVVDSAGAAQIVNGTAFTVSIEAYDILSAYGSLEFVDGTWDSLQDQGTSGGNWFEANVSAERISELLITGGLELAPGASVPLGSPFDGVNGKQDLEFQFAVFEDRRGDFDQDGDVDGQDFLVWQRGESPDPLSASDLSDWQANFGAQLISAENEMVAGKVWYSPGASSLAAVPEPGALGLLSAGLSLLLGATRRRMYPLG